jgi:predicted glycosyltransferase
MRVWVDLTNSPHVLVFRPLIRLLQERGDEVEVTAREYAQTMQLLELHRIEATAVGRHGGASTVGKARAEVSRVPTLRRWAKGRNFDLALAHGSHDLTLTARSLGIPSATTFDYEFAWLQHQLGCRAATRVVVPDVIPADRLARYGVRPPKLRTYPGLKEEYYLADFEPDPTVARGLGVDPVRRLVVVRTPPEVSLYHRHGNPLFLQVLDRLGRDDRVHAVVLPRTDEQREAIRGLALPSLVVPERAVDAQSLIAGAAAVVSAGGTMNREAVALGSPVFTTFGGMLGAVDDALVRDGRLVRLTDAAQLDLDALPPRGERLHRDPRVLLGLLTRD